MIRIGPLSWRISTETLATPVKDERSGVKIVCEKRLEEEVAFIEEECLFHTDKPLTNQQRFKLGAFRECVKNSRDDAGYQFKEIEGCISYCRCMVAI